MGDALGGTGSGPAGAAAGLAGAAAVPAGRLRRFQWLATLGAAARTRRGVVGLVLTGFVLLTAVVGPLVTPYSSSEFVTSDFSPPDGHFLLGGDALGRDVLSRVLDGGWVLLVMAVAATAFGIIVGGAAGVSAAYLRGRTDGLIMRTVDVILAFPQLVFALLLVSIIGPKLWLIVVAVGFSHAPAVARVLRSATLDVSERDFVKSIELEGVTPARIMVREILPNLVSPLMVEIGLRLTYSIVVMAGLSFLGFGQQPPAPNWGTMINENRLGMTVNAWGVIVPAALIAVLTIGTNTFTDAIARVAIGVERPPEEAILVDDIGLGETVALR
jgi:peptide/nickel transport system permease protein